MNKEILMNKEMNILNKLKNNYWLLAILAFGSILRFYHIDFQSPWLDEIHTLNESNPNISFFDLYDVIMSGEQMPPLYFYLLYFIFKIFGYTIFVARTFSALLGVFSLYSIYLLGKELVNKRVGLISAFILGVNYFHLYYSQEARPYVLLMLFTIFSFYKLVVYVKKPNIKNALLYGLFAGLMINSHFFGLFTLFTQCFILLIFLILSEKTNKKTFFINSFLAGILVLILFIPAIKIFIKVTEIKEFWIPAPTIDAYTLVFREFFGNSELILCFIGVFLFFYFIKISKVKDFPISYERVVKDKEVFAFLILISWTVITILIPLVRSYLSTPMIISRYFIVVLPAIVLLLSIGLQQFKNKIIQIGLLILFLVISLVDIFVVKNYYNGVFKAQFREATSFIKENNDKLEPVVSSLDWYLPYFFNNESKNQEIIGKTLDLFVAEMYSDSTKIKPFWYLDGHGREFNPNDETLDFLNKYFYVENNYDAFQAWTKHFILLKDVPKTIDISSYKEIKLINGDLFIFNIENFEFDNDNLKVSGWAYFENQESLKTVINIVLVKEETTSALRLNTQKVNRPDVTKYFNSSYSIDHSGFQSNLDISNLDEGKYKIAIFLQNKETRKEGLIITDKEIEK